MSMRAENVVWGMGKLHPMTDRHTQEVSEQDNLILFIRWFHTGVSHGVCRPWHDGLMGGHGVPPELAKMHGLSLQMTCMCEDVKRLKKVFVLGMVEVSV